MISNFDDFEIEMTLKQAHSTYHQGQCDEDVRKLLLLPEIKNQFKNISIEKLIKELKKYGGWSDEELKNRLANEMRIIWIAAGNILDDNH